MPQKKKSDPLFNVVDNNTRRTVDIDIYIYIVISIYNEIRGDPMDHTIQTGSLPVACLG